jgi:hypothetical protein
MIGMAPHSHIQPMVTRRQDRRKFQPWTPFPTPGKQHGATTLETPLCSNA